MSIKRKIARKQAWQELPPVARRYGVRHANIDRQAVKASVLHACHATGKFGHVACNTDGGGSVPKSTAFARLSFY